MSQVSRNVNIKINLTPGQTSQFGDAFKSVFKDIEGKKTELEKFRIRLDPSTMAENVGLDLQKAEFKKHHDRAYNKELLKQGGIGKVFEQKGLGGLADVAGISEAFEGLAGPVGIAVAAVTAAITVFTKLAQAAVDFAKVASPGTVDRYEQAWQDLYGVIGQQLTPVVELFTEVVKTLADIMKTVADLDPDLFTFKQILAEITYVLHSMRTLGESVGLSHSATGSAARGAKFGNVGSYLNSAYTAAASRWFGASRCRRSSKALTARWTAFLASWVELVERLGPQQLPGQRWPTWGFPGHRSGAS